MEGRSKQDVMVGLVEKAEGLNKEAENANFAGLLQESIQKYLQSANVYLEAIKYSPDEQTSTAMRYLAENQRSKAKEMMKRIEGVHPVIIHRTDYYGNLENQEYEKSPKPSTLITTPPLKASRVSNSPREFSWQRFWEHVEELLEILPKPIFEESTATTNNNNNSNSNSTPQRGNGNSGHRQRSYSAINIKSDYISDNQIKNTSSHNNFNSYPPLTGTTNTYSSLEVTQKQQTPPPTLQRNSSDDDFFVVRQGDTVNKKGAVPIIPIENYDPSSTLKDERIQFLEEENKMLKLSIVRFREQLKEKAKKLHIFEPTEDDIKSHEIECGIGMYIGKQLQKINQLEKDLSLVKEQLAELYTKHNQVLQRNEFLEKRWNDLKNAAKMQ